MSTPRRTFLSMLGFGAFAAATSPASAHAGGFPKPVDGTWDLSWTARVKGRYRGVFDASSVGDAARRATMWRTQYAKVFGIDEPHLSAVLVIRHHGIPMVMNDAFWDEFGIAKAVAKQNHDDESTANFKGNPARPEIETFLANGGIVLACNVAFGLMVGHYHGDDARKQAMDHLLPGVILQPSGPFALMRAQDEGCNYMLAS